MLIHLHSRPLLLALMVLLACQAGCVRRRLTIRSNVPGALVYVDDREIGFTPVSTPFTYYGTRKIQVIKDGYETETVLERIHPPFYQIPPLDFIAENLWPWELRDERVVDFQLRPQQTVSTDALQQRAESLRSGSQQGVVTPLLHPPPPTVAPPIVAPQAAPGNLHHP